MSLLSRNLRTASGGITDPYFEYNTLLLTGDGTNGAQNNTFIDSSPNNLAITRAGNTTQGSFSPYGSLWSNYFSTITTDYLSFPSSSATNLTTSNFTFECSFYKTGSPANEANLIWWNGNSNANSTCAFRIQLNKTANTISLLCSENGTSWQINTTSTATYTDNTWNHIAGVRNGQTITVYLNGVSVVSGSLSAANASLYAGTLNYLNNMLITGNWKMTGYISNVRLLVGTALYTSTFTPPTAPLTAIANTQLLTCQSNRFKDHSTNNFTVTRVGDVKVRPFSPYPSSTPYQVTKGASAYFDGTGDSLSLSAGSNWAFGTGDFTVEAWVYLSASTTSRLITNRQALAGLAGTWSLNLSSTTMAFTEVVVGEPGPLATFSSIVGSWNHVAACRSSGVTKLFLNGTQVASATQTTNFSTTTQPLTIGASPSENYIPGFVSGLHVIKGTALYTTSFTPTTSPVTSVTNTVLLLNSTNAKIVDATAKNSVETVGNSQINTSIKKYGTGSMYFDGTGDWLAIPYSDNLVFGTGNFTIEYWCYPTLVTSSTRRHISMEETNNSLCIRQNGSVIQVFFRFGTTTVVAASAAVNFTLNTWQHIALVRSGSSFVLYKNGVSVISLTNTGSISPTSNLLTVSGGDPEGYTGYIDDVRITKGIARYTANFTPPTRALPLK